MKIGLYDQQFKKVKDVNVNDDFFGASFDDNLIAHYIYCYLSNQRQASAHTKDRSEVRGGGRKPWRQKGTGRARHGSSRSPIWKGGGVTFGPRKDKNYKKKVTKAFRKAAFKHAFSKIMNKNMIRLVSDFNFDGKKPLTSQAKKIIKNFGQPQKMTIVTSEKNDLYLSAFSNIQNVKVIIVTELNVYDLIEGGDILLDMGSLEYINSKWAK